MRSESPTRKPERGVVLDDTLHDQLFQHRVVIVKKGFLADQRAVPARSERERFRTIHGLLRLLEDLLNQDLGRSAHKVPTRSR